MHIKHYQKEFVLIAYFEWLWTIQFTALFSSIVAALAKLFPSLRMICSLSHDNDSNPIYQDTR